MGRYLIFLRMLQKDTLELWDSIVSNKLLSRTEIILFLNKYDILRQKLDLGVRFSKFVTSYRDRNTAESVGKCTSHFYFSTY